MSFVLCCAVLCANTNEQHCLQTLTSDRFAYLDWCIPKDLFQELICIVE